MNRWRLYAFGGVAAVAVAFVLLQIMLQPTAAVQEPSALAALRDEPAHSGAASSRITRPAATVRGAILDATGQLMVGDTSYDSLYADPLRVTAPDRLAVVLSPMLGTSEEELVRRLSAKQRDGILVQSGLTAEQVTQIRRLARPELQIRTEARRGYPEGKLAAAVLGLVGRDGRGLTGLEAGFDAELSGRQGISREAAYRGADLVLTLDRFAQRIAENELEKAVAAARGSGGVVIVMDPGTGAVLALAAMPGFDPKQLIDEGQAATYRHPAASSAFEPVSLVRFVTIASAIDAGAVAPDHTFLNRSTPMALPTPTRDTSARAGTKPSGTATPSGAEPVLPRPENMTQVIQRASEVGTAYVVNRLGTDSFYRYLGRFGFGQPTGIGLGDESGGKVPQPGNLDSQAFGQGLQVTPLQLAAAASAIANGGLLMQPYLVQEVRMGEVRVPYDPRLIRQAISPAAARAVKQMLAATVTGPEASASQAALPSHTVAGLASTPGASAGGDSATFVGFLPVESPRFTVLVKIDRPQTSTSGAEVAAPVFRTVAEQLVAYYRVVPSTGFTAGRSAIEGAPAGGGTPSTTATAAATATAAITATAAAGGTGAAGESGTTGATR